MDVGIKTANDQFQSVTTTERTAITSPIVGQCVWDSDLRQLMVYMNATTGNAWQPIGNSIVCASTTRPVTPFEGQEIYETDTNRSWTYNGAAFVPNDMVFTTEAARDAAITSPTEGMRAYLTASTVAAATGATTTVPTGVQTIYNGTNWVCVTPVGAFSIINTANTASTSYVTTLTADTTAISVTLVTGTTAKIDLNAHARQNSADSIFLTYSVSGATTIAAADVNGARVANGLANLTAAYARSAIITGLTAGTNTFTLNYRVTAGTSTWETRNLVVSGVA